MEDIELSNISDSDLEKELKRRKSERKAAPKPIDNPDFASLREVVVRFINQCVEDQFQHDDMKAFIYEEAVKAVYGEKFFEWRNKQDW